MTHQYIGYLLPMGPFFAVFHRPRRARLGGPAPVAGLHPVRGGLGVLYLCRILGMKGPGPTAAALAYMLSPYFLQYAGRISVILLPWAGLPFMLGLTIVALRRGGWREPALFAFVVALVSGINASSRHLRRGRADPVAVLRGRRAARGDLAPRARRPGCASRS